MSERMLVTQALDERDLLVKKITDKIHRFTDSRFSVFFEYLDGIFKEKSGKRRCGGRHLYH